MAYLKRPYHGKTRQEIREKVLSRQASVTYDRLPSGWSLESCDFLNALLERKPDHRLANLRSHPWLKSLDWNRLFRKEIKPPFLPTLADDFFSRKGSSKHITDDQQK